MARLFTEGEVRRLIAAAVAEAIAPLQAIRHVAIDRRVTQGTRGTEGMRWCERAWTVLATCAQQGLRVFQFLHDALLAQFRAQPASSLLP